MQRPTMSETAPRTSWWGGAYPGGAGNGGVAATATHAEQPLGDMDAQGNDILAFYHEEE